MPTPVDNLTKDSSAEAIKKAVSECISIEVRGGEKQDRAVAMCLNMARAKTGRTQLLKEK